MVLGQLALPIMITWAFQSTILGIAALVLPRLGAIDSLGRDAVCAAIVTFATENALFLAYPHHQRHEGVAMMLRTKLTFLGKGTALVIAVCLLVL